MPTDRHSKRSGSAIGKKPISARCLFRQDRAAAGRLSVFVRGFRLTVQQHIELYLWDGRDGTYRRIPAKRWQQTPAGEGQPGSGVCPACKSPGV